MFAMNWHGDRDTQYYRHDNILIAFGDKTKTVMGQTSFKTKVPKGKKWTPQNSIYTHIFGVLKVPCDQMASVKAAVHIV